MAPRGPSRDGRDEVYEYKNDVLYTFIAHDADGICCTKAGLNKCGLKVKVDCRGAEETLRVAKGSGESRLRYPLEKVWMAIDERKSHKTGA